MVSEDSVIMQSCRLLLITATEFMTGTVAFAVIEQTDDGHDVTLERVSYGIDRTISLIKETGLPVESANRLVDGR